MGFIDINNPIVRERRKDADRAIAQKIRNRLQQLENATEKDKRRWIWELLQNANDTVEGNRKVDIKIVITNDFIEFRHNGGYFSPRNITNLVHQISSKEGEESIGRFGTGFLTTHTLSRIVKVSGIYAEEENYTKFKINLFRTGNTEAELVKCLNETWDTFDKEELEEKPENVIWTSFKYSNYDKKIAEDTINDFVTFVHYNLAFVQSIGTITIDNQVLRKEFFIERKNIQKIDNTLSLIAFEGKNDNGLFEKNLLVADNSRVQIAIEVEKLSGSLTIKEIESNVPRLFCAFPLIGTEDFLFPMVINSKKFMPKTERDGLYLKGETNQTEHNKDLLKETLSLYDLVLKYFSNQKAERLFFLAQNENPFRDDNFDIHWYNLAIQKPLQEKILNSPIVKTKTGTLETVKSILFPYQLINGDLDLGMTNKIWEFQADLYPNRIPQKSDVENWANVLWEGCKKVDLEHLAKYFEEIGTIQGLEAKLKVNNSDIDVFDWYNQVINFYIIKRKYLLDNYRISPNQEQAIKGRFCYKKNLYADNEISGDLKDVYEVFTEIKPWRKELASQRIKSLKKLLVSEKKIRSPYHIIQGINAKIENEKTNQSEVQKAVFKLTSLIPLRQKATEKQHNCRNDIYAFSKALFKEAIPDFKGVDNLPLDTWDKSDIWILNSIVKAIEGAASITNLHKQLDLERQDEVVGWLNSFFSFLLKANIKVYLSNKIYPNQLGNFSYKSDLNRDEKISDEFKNILRELHILNSNEEKTGWKEILLDSKITAFDSEEKLRIKTTKNISDEINKQIAEIEEVSFERLKSPMFKLITFMKSENEHQKKIWEYLRAFYLDEVPKQLQIVENAEVFNWKPCFLWCMELIIKNVTTLKYVDELEEKLYGNITALNWLADFIEFIHETEAYKKLLDGDEYAVIPNQNGNFQIKNRLWADVEINEDLKKIIGLLNPVWLDDLLENQPIFLDLPKEKERTTTDAAVEVNRIFRTYDDDAQKTEYVQSFRILSKWMNKTEQKFIRQNMDWVNVKKAEIALSLLGSEKEKDDVFLIIESGKASLLSRLANNKNITNEDLRKFIENPHLANNSNQPSNDIIKEQTGGKANSVEELIEKYNQLLVTVEEQKLKANANPKFIVRKETQNQTTDWEAVKRSNELARERIRAYLGTIKENDQRTYDLGGWTKKTNTIIENILKNGIHIGLVTKGADNGIVYFNSSEREFLSDTQKFTELWVHSNEEIFQITLGEILKIWNAQGIKTNMFDFK